jgi:hypothetical protein
MPKTAMTASPLNFLDGPAARRHLARAQLEEPPDDASYQLRVECLAHSR